jgi:hypothetical protein
MNPYLEIRKKYVEDGDATIHLSWEELVGFHLANKSCYVIKGPDFFVMGRAVCKEADPIHIRDLTYVFEKEDCNAWFLYAFSGDMAKAFRAIPYELPWLAWDRFHDQHGDMRFMPIKTVRRLCG